MADRTVAVRLTANVQGFVAGMRTAQKSAQDFTAKGLDKIHANEAQIGQLANTVGILGLAMVGAAGSAVKAAIDWESAWAGVLKTVDGTPAQLAAIEEGLRGLTKELPASHAEIAGVAEAAGQLGIAAEDVVEFTRTMINLGETTNLSADEAATALARISNIMGTSADDVDRMGSTIVDLGNNSATTEREIVELATRLAAAGKQAGLAEQDIFAIAATLTSVGVEAEAGGTAMSKVFTSIADAVRDGGDNLATFAEVSGVTVAEFKRAFEQDAAGAIGMFVEGMGRLGAEGQSTSKVFQELGLTDERLKRSILSAGSATGLWADNLDLAGRAWEENTALAIEAQKRYETSAAQIQIAWNGIKDAAIDFGATVLPMLAKVVDGIAGLADGFNNLSGPIQSVITLLVGGGGLVLLGLAGLAKLVVGVASTKAALVGLGVTAKTTRLAVAAIGGALSIAALGLTAWISKTAAADAAAEEYKGTLDAVTGALTDQTRATVFDNLYSSGAIEAANRLGVEINDVIDAALGSADALKRLGIEEGQRANELAANVGGILARNDAERDWITISQSVLGESESLTEAQKRLKASREAGIATDEDAVDAQVAVAETYDTTTGAIDGQTEALAELVAMQREAAGEVLALRDAQSGLEAAYDAAAAAVEENGATLDITTEKGRANQAALDDIADAGWDLIESMEATGSTSAELQDSMATTRERFIGAAESMGMAKGDAEALADQLGLIPGNVNTTINVSDEEAKIRADRFILAYSNRVIPMKINATGVAQIRTPAGVQVPVATGGYITGPGTATSDSIPARLSNGEYVVKTAAVQRYGKAFFDDINTMRFASGGFVGGAPSASSSAPVAGGINYGGVTLVAEDPAGALREFDAYTRRKMAGVS